MWTQESFSWDGEWLKLPERIITPKPVQQPHPPMWTAATQPSTIEAAGRMGLGVLIFGQSYGRIEEFVSLYRKAITEAEPIGAFVNNRFAVHHNCLCAPTDDEAIAIQGRNFKWFINFAKEIFTPWLEGEAPKSYEYVVEIIKELIHDVDSVSAEDIVASGGAAIGSPETILATFQHLADSGVDEVLLLMQLRDTPHEAIMRSIELIATEVMPKLK
jgi:alkanesulfonate monooxygenase SsuD/methylene tetrahydromethanopterin reductase-like flavin-dependent oxidoreductase (luciferase family)